jgi:hypothetical protein
MSNDQTLGYDLQSDLSVPTLADDDDHSLNSDHNIESSLDAALKISSSDTQPPITATISTNPHTSTVTHQRRQSMPYSCQLFINISGILNRNKATIEFDFTVGKFDSTVHAFHLKVLTRQSFVFMILKCRRDDPPR